MFQLMGLLTAPIANIESLMRASPAGSARRSAVENDRVADIVKISIFNACTKMANGTGRKGNNGRQTVFQKGI